MPTRTQERCPNCDRPIATDDDYESTAEGAGHEAMDQLLAVCLVDERGNQRHVRRSEVQADVGLKPTPPLTDAEMQRVMHGAKMAYAEVLRDRSEPTSAAEEPRKSNVGCDWWPTRPHRLTWNGTEWVAPCGCRYHPDDDNGSHGGAPHVHRCERHTAVGGTAPVAGEGGAPTRRVPGGGARPGRSRQRWAGRT